MINEGFNALEDKFFFLSLLNANFYFEEYLYLLIYMLQGFYIGISWEKLKRNKGAEV
jgi:hypothetical protein